MIREDYMSGIILPSAVSQNEKAMQYLFNHQMLISLGSNAPELFEIFNFPISLKDAQTGKCILTNSHDGYLHKGLKTLQLPSDLIGLTTNDITEMSCFIPPDIASKSILKINVDNANRAHMEKIKIFEDEVKMHKRQGTRSLISISSTGFITKETVVKQPLLSQDKRKVIAILTCSYDRTPCLNLLDLLQLYLEHYQNKFAIKVLLQYLNIAHYFKALPTAREMQVLLLMRDNSHRKYIGRQLNISRNTAASHIQHIKELKLIKPDIDEVAIQLRRVPANLSIDTGNI
jgi:hypothetical protein